MEKLKLIEANLKKSLDLCEWVLRRERKKRDLAVRAAPLCTHLITPWGVRKAHGSASEPLSRPA